MRKTLLGLFLVLATAVMAGSRTPEQAAEIAAQFTNQQPRLRRLHAADRKADSFQLAHQVLQKDTQTPAFYVFNQTDDKGFVIVSADDRTADEVIAYSEEGGFNYENANPHLRWWLNRFAEEITALQTIPDSDFVSAPTPRKAKQVTAIAPLLKNAAGQEITWDQEKPYYNLCPMDQRDNTRSLTGCVATATSMVMYKWRWPLKGTGSSSYIWYDCLNDNCTERGEYVSKRLSANYGETTYEWDNMLPSYANVNYTATQANAVATLMYHVGVACQMQYGGDENYGSGALTDNMAHGLIHYFGYEIDKFISMYSKNEYYEGYPAPDGVTGEFSVTAEQFEKYFNADLEAGRPILLGGEDKNDGGHEFVCDGRDATGRFHINWGWEGDGNCYTTLTTLKPSNSTSRFCEGLDAIIGLRPAQAQAVETVSTEPRNAAKVIDNGRVVIIRDNTKHNILGQFIQ